MCQTIIVLIIIGSVALCAITTGFLVLINKLNNMAELCNRLRDRWASTENLCKKLDVAIMWLIEEKGVTLEQSQSWVNPWYIVPLKNKYQREMEKAFNEVYAHREEIAQALLDALKKWDEEREAKWESKKGGKK